MWYLVDSKGKRFYLKPDKEVTFGRKKGDMLFPNDESLSRLHAVVCVKTQNILKSAEPTSSCTIKDLGSKYGTYINQGDDSIQVTEEGYNLKHHDRVRFGLQDNIFLVVNVPLITVISSLNDNDKDKLESVMNDIDGVIHPNWISFCTHLTVTKPTLTEKVTCAMASAIPIVTVDYWEQVKLAVENNDVLPDAKDFIPTISESLVNKQIVSLCPNKERRTLFKNLVFVHFSSEQYKMYGKIICLAGGKPILYSKRPLSNKELCTSNVIVLQYPSSDTTQSTQNIVSEYDSICKALQTSNRKMIAGSEIPLAILHCSTDKYCNPTFKFAKLLKRSQSKRDPSQVLVLDTQDVSPDFKKFPEVISNVPVRSEFDKESQSQAVAVIPETYDDFDSTDLSNVDFVSRPKNIQKSNKPQVLKETNDSCIDSSVDVHKCSEPEIVKETNDSYVNSSVEIEKFWEPRVIKETIDTCVDNSVEVQYIEPRVIKETNDSCTDNLLEIEKFREPQIIQETNESYVGSSVETQKFREPQIIQETNESYDDSSVEIQKFREPQIIQETNDAYTDNSIEVQNSIDPQIIQETNDIRADSPIEIKNEEGTRITRSEANAVYIPETNDPFSSDMLSENSRCFTRYTEDLKTQQNTGVQSIDPLNGSMIDNKRTPFNEMMDVSEDEEFESKEILLNTNDGKSVNAACMPKEFDYLSKINTTYKSSFLRAIPGQKTFKKNHCVIPEKRIGLSDMYVWNK